MKMGTSNLIFILAALIAVAPIDSIARQDQAYETSGSGLLPSLDTVASWLGFGHSSPKVKIPPVASSSECEKATISIKTPTKGLQVSYDSGGVLTIGVFAHVQPLECEKQVKWKIDPIGEAKPSHIPEKYHGGYIEFNKMPKENNSFGKKTITATIEGSGQSATTEVEVFFDPEGKSHPGAYASPNWFYYWKQIKAIIGGRDIGRLSYQSQIAAAGTAGAQAAGQYSFAFDRVYLSDLIVSATGCNERRALATKSPTGVRAQGIDCFAEDIWHEYTHRTEMFGWWGSYSALIKGRLSGEDDDNDIVPAIVESRTLGCSDKNAFSCTQRPFNNVPDSDTNTYWAGWTWRIGSVDKQDWSVCGKQWNDRKGCPY